MERSTPSHASPSCDRSVSSATTATGASTGCTKRLLCSSGSVDDIEHAPAMCRGPGRMVCVGDRCYPIRECAKAVATELSGGGGGGTTGCPELQARSDGTSSGCSSSSISARKACLEEGSRWLPFGPTVKPLFKQGFVWVLAAPPCASKHIVEPMAEFLSSYEDTEEDSRRVDIPDARGSDCDDPLREQLKLAARFPRIRFQSCDEIRLCEKAISVYGRAPFFALVHVPNSKAFVLDILELGECTAQCGCYDPSRRCAAFRSVDRPRVAEFIRQAVSGSWPRARMGECAPPFDEDESLDASCTLTAVLHTIPRLVRGTVDLFSQAKLIEDAEASTGPCLRQVAAGPCGSGPLLVLFTLWAPRCPCCPGVIKVLDCIVNRLNSTVFRENYPSCPLLSMNATIRHVVCDVDKNDLPDSEWPRSPADGLDVDTPSPSLRPSPTTTSSLPDFLGSTMPPAALPSTSSSGSSGTGAAYSGAEVAYEVRKSLPCIMTYRDGNRVAHFLGVRTPKNLVRYVVRSFGAAPRRCVSNQDEDLSTGWFYSLVEEAERADEESTNSLMKKRGRSDLRVQTQPRENET